MGTISVIALSDLEVAFTHLGAFETATHLGLPPTRSLWFPGSPFESDSYSQSSSNFSVGDEIFVRRLGSEDDGLLGHAFFERTQPMPKRSYSLPGDEPAGEDGAFEGFTFTHLALRTRSLISLEELSAIGPDSGPLQYAQGLELKARWDRRAPRPSTWRGGVSPMLDDPDPIFRLSRVRPEQREFVEAVKRRWGCRCLVTGIEHDALLHAAHIKPYSEASALERCDPANGLILASHIHAAFDAHLFTIEIAGTLRVSERRLSGADRERLALPTRIQGIVPGETAEYLSYTARVSMNVKGYRTRLSSVIIMSTNNDILLLVSS